MKTKIVEVPISDKKVAEDSVNEQIAAIEKEGKILSQITLDERRILVFYEAKAKAKDTSSDGK